MISLRFRSSWATFALLLFLPVISYAQVDPFYQIYMEKCSTCHGMGFKGAAQGPPLAQAYPTETNPQDEIVDVIANGVIEKGMPAFGEVLNENEIKRLAILISEVRMTGVKMTDFYNVNQAFSIPSGIIETEKHNFKIEAVATGLDPLPYSIAALPDGRILVTEKMKGLRIVESDGSLSPLIEGTPQTYGDAYHAPAIFLKYGNGWMLDIAPHPEFADNGWVYMTFGDRCSACNFLSRNSGSDVSMLKLVRGRIESGAWVDQETIWEADSTLYTPMPDMTLGGRIAFDDSGHLYFTLGMKGISNYSGVQSLSEPHGKTHRIHYDGSIPEDNPYVNTPNAVPSIWSYGHRSPQGLEYNPRTQQLWGTEMGPRGGDEVNLIEPAKNYGWPLHSKGLNYDGTPVAYGKQLGIEVDLTKIEQTKIDLTPSPAISSFIIHDGSTFPEWKDNLIVGSLKATELYRMVVDGDQIVHTETIIKDFARIRDVEQASDGTIYLLLEHADGGQIVRLIPE